MKILFDKNIKDRSVFFVNTNDVIENQILGLKKSINDKIGDLNIGNMVKVAETKLLLEKTRNIVNAIDTDDHSKEYILSMWVDMLDYLKNIIWLDDEGYEV